MRLPWRAGLVFLITLLLLTGACTDAGDERRADPRDFESDFPLSAAGADDAGEDVDSAASADPTSSADADQDSADHDSVQRAIVAADLVQLSGDTLYALSRTGGLSIVDVSDPRSLKLLGRYRELAGEPVEMYLQDGVIFALFRRWSEYVKAGDRYDIVQTGKLLSLDVSDPAAISVLGDFAVPGRISDARHVGNVLYIVGFEDGACSGCSTNQQRTTIVSVDVSDPRTPRKIDQLAFNETQAASSWRCSVTVSDKRMYVAGPNHGPVGLNGSTIQVVDISDPGGHMAEGAVVRVPGRVASRWQVDEYHGVLRVVSQPSLWSARGQEPPSVQTYRVVSATELTPLGRTTLRVPNGHETLRSVRFDGARAYAVTSQKQDPLYTIDLSDPARPRQMGELHMPGSRYAMEPRGARMVGLSFDQGNAEGAITVTVFDVSSLATPKLLSRVHFGGAWSSLSENQDQSREALRILPELGLILVPFGGLRDVHRADGKRCADGYESAVQLIDFADDTLRPRGTAPSEDQAGRTLVHRDHLFMISDARAETFDIRDRDAPSPAGGIALAHDVERVVPLARGIAARIHASSRSRAPWVDFVEVEQVDAPHISLGALALDDALRGDSPCSPYRYVEAAFGTDAQLEILYRRYEYSYDYRDSQEVAGLLVIDASDPSAPRLKGKVEWNMRGDDGASNYQWYSDALDPSAGDNPNAVRFARAGTTWVALEWSSDARGETPRTKARLRSVDLSEPSAPKTRVVDLSDRHYTSLFACGDDLLLSYAQTGATPGRVRYYVQAITASAPLTAGGSARERANDVIFGDAIHVPDRPMYDDARRGRAITRVDGRQTTSH